MNINELIKSTQSVPHGTFTKNSAITSLSYDSRTVEPGCCFFAVVGTQSDGHDFIPMALSKGASAVVCERLPEPATMEQYGDVAFVTVASSQAAMADMAKAFYGDPSRDLKLVGVTGTNGKTTTATLLADLFEGLGYATGLISTVVYRVAGEEIPSTHTTPDTIRLNAMLRKMVDAGCEYCFMEVSSHSLVQDRVRGLRFAGALFTNLTHDHLDYHGTFAEYLSAKRRLFDMLPKGSFALTNVDDRNGDVMVQNSRATVTRYSLRGVADLTARVVEIHFDGMLMQIDGEQLWVRLLGRFNCYNMLAIYGVARAFGVDKGELLVAMSRLGSVAGRFEHFAAAGGRTVIVDYAHTPDALRSVLDTIAEISQGSRGVITVCGCGGDRDRSKRGEMARIAYRGSTTSIFTSDNPRGEDPEMILSEMVAGLDSEPREDGHRFLKITDRREAINAAVMLSQAGDVILVAGKGHERYQVVGSERRHFDDREEARMAAERLLE